MDLRTVFVHLMVCAGALCVKETEYHKTKDSNYLLKADHNSKCPRGILPVAKLLPHEEDCSLFYICQNGQAILQKCPSKLHFNPTKSVCDFPGNAKCKEEDISDPRGRIGDKDLVVKCPISPTQKLLPHPTDCSKFFTCDAERVAHPSTCQQGLHFNVEKQTCDYPENAGCFGRRIYSQDKSYSDNIVSRERIGDGVSNRLLCPAKKSDFPVLLPHPSDCGKFYICDGGTPHLKVCHPGLHFNPKTQTCDYPRNAGCESSIEIENDSECPAVNSGNPVLLPHKTDCGKFYICDGGVPHAKVCQAGLHFNPKVQACDYPANAGCGTDPSSKGRLGDVGICPASPLATETILVPHPDDCTQFFMCSNGQSYAKKCPPRLHFSTSLQACDYPENAQCEKEVRHLAPGVSSPFCPTIEGQSPVFYRHPTNCSVFFMCSHGLAYKFECPARLHFNLRQKVCDYEWNARCPTPTGQ